MAQDVFDACPGCKKKTLLRTRSVYKCPKCFRFFCTKCVIWGLIQGYKCPGCKYHVGYEQLPQLKAGYC
jgi:hypothetical protein